MTRRVASRTSAGVPERITIGLTLPIKDDPSAHDVGDAIETDLASEALEFVDPEPVAEDFEEMVGPAAHVKGQAAVEMIAEFPIERKDKVLEHFLG